jgi:electron transfer flavoprotein beta subunit
MKIVVCVKQVPDTEAEKRLLPDTLTVDRESSNPVLNEMDEFAIEEALKLVEAHGGEVAVLTMGPDGADAVVRKALSMGADSGILLTNPALAGSDAVATSYAIAQALATTEYDLVIMGSEASDARTSLVPAMLAERLNLPQLTFASKVEIDGTDITVNRLTDYGHDVVKAQLPAVVSVVEKINEPRYPSFKGIMAAKSKPLESKTLADTGLDAGAVGLAAAPSQVVEFANKPPRQAGQIVKDEGDGGSKVAEFLASQKFI